MSRYGQLKFLMWPSAASVSFCLHPFGGLKLLADDSFSLSEFYNPFSAVTEYLVTQNNTWWRNDDAVIMWRAPLAGEALSPSKRMTQCRMSPSL